MIHHPTGQVDIYGYLSFINHLSNTFYLFDYQYFIIKIFIKNNYQNPCAYQFFFVPLHTGRVPPLNPQAGNENN